MKSVKLSLFALLMFFSCSLLSRPVLAQVDLDTLPFKHIEIGPMFTAGLSIFQGDVPDGSKTDVHFAFTGGALFAYSFHPNWGIGFGLGYESRGMTFHPQNVDNPKQDITLNYLSVQPSLKFKQFLLGVNLGIPLSSSQTIAGATAGFADPVHFPDSYSSSFMNMMIDIRAEGLLPIVENDNGALYFIINASYNMSDALTAFYTIGQSDSYAKAVTKNPVPTLQLGLSYMLAPGGKTH